MRYSHPFFLPLITSQRLKTKRLMKSSGVLSRLSAFLSISRLYIISSQVLKNQLFHAVTVFVGACIDFNFVAGIDEQRHLNFKARRQLGGFQYFTR